MRSTRSCITSLLLLSIGAPLVHGQSRIEAQRITSPIRHRGTYHLASGTWSAATPASAVGNQVLYSNTAQTGYFFGATPTWTPVDHGRVPSTSSPSTPTSVTGTSDFYSVVCFELAYCSDMPPANGRVAIETSFFDLYAPCSDIDAPGVGSVATFLASGLPPGTPSGGAACWIVAFNLSNTTLAFGLNGDADGTWDADRNLDSFGWSMTYLTAQGTGSNVGTGPIIAGNCPGPGGATVPQQGFGTDFGGVPGATDSTGLGTDDFFWIDDDGGQLTPNANGGCFFFGGCTGPAPGADYNPFGGFWLKLFGEVDTSLYTPYCSSLPNASGGPAVLGATGTDPNVDLALTASPVPNTTGLFFYGPMMLGGALSLGDGLRCIGGSTTRIVPSVTAGMMMQPPNGAVLSINYSAPYAAGLTGSRNFQYWFRSGLATGTGSNTSDAISISF